MTSQFRTSTYSVDFLDAQLLEKAVDREAELALRLVIIAGLGSEIRSVAGSEEVRERTYFG